jgi:hypothetical protein
MKLALLDEEFGVARLDPTADTPAWAFEGSLYSITRTPEELSIVCAAELIPVDVQAERGFRCLRIVGRLDLSLTGILASIARPLAVAKISIFTISTYDTDYILVQNKDLAAAIDFLRTAGHKLAEA